MKYIKIELPYLPVEKGIEKFLKTDDDYYYTKVIKNGDIKKYPKEKIAQANGYPKILKTVSRAEYGDDKEYRKILDIFNDGNCSISYYPKNLKNKKEDLEKDFSKLLTATNIMNK